MSFQDIQIVRQFNLINGFVTTDRGRGTLASALTIPGVSMRELTVHDQKWVETVGGTVECCAEPPATQISRDIVDTVTPSPETPEYPTNPCECPLDYDTYINIRLNVNFYDQNGNTPYIMQEVCGCDNSWATGRAVLYPDTGRQDYCYWSAVVQNTFTVTVTFDRQLCLWIITISCGYRIMWRGSSVIRDGIYYPYGGPWCAPFGWISVYYT